ncbi:hypothetical protein BHM03_00056063 [Ensete ventricosum]|nr:hypothetical protein BHM03_00056063 [Ensete ventricosum]
MSPQSFSLRRRKSARDPQATTAHKRGLRAGDSEELEESGADAQAAAEHEGVVGEPPSGEAKLLQIRPDQLVVAAAAERVIRLHPQVGPRRVRHPLAQSHGSPLPFPGYDLREGTPMEFLKDTGGSYDAQERWGLLCSWIREDSYHESSPLLTHDRWVRIVRESRELSRLECRATRWKLLERETRMNRNGPTGSRTGSQLIPLMQ